MNSQSKSTDTKAHIMLQSAIHAAGFSCATEVYFQPYTVDCYIEEAHLALEVDGKPWHDARIDAIRDAYLLETYNLHVIRFPEVALLIKRNWPNIVNIIIQGVLDVTNKEP